MKNNTNYSCLTIWKMLCVDTIFKMAVAVGLFLLKISLFGQNKYVAWEKMHFTWFSRRDGFSPTRHQILPSPLRGSGQDTVSSWEKTPSLLENHVKCISCSGAHWINGVLFDQVRFTTRCYFITLFIRIICKLIGGYYERECTT